MQKWNENNPGNVNLYKSSISVSRSFTTYNGISSEILQDMYNLEHSI